MIDYHADVIFTANIVLFAASICLGLSTVLYVLTAAIIDRIRAMELHRIKKALYSFALSGNTGKKCFTMAGGVTVQQFLDVSSNRLRDTVFFNEAEQEIFKGCFLKTNAVKSMEKAASGNAGRWHRIEALLCLGYAGLESSVPVLERSSASQDPEIVYFSILSLGLMKSPAAAAALLGLIKTNPLMRRKIISVLAEFPPATAKLAVKYLDDPDPSVRLWIVKLLSQLKSSAYREKIELLAIDEPDADVRSAACGCLGEMSGDASIEVLKKCLKDEAWFVRMHALRSISKILGQASIPVLLQSLNDNSLSVIEEIYIAVTKHYKTLSLAEKEKVLSRARSLDGTLARKLEVEGV